MGTELEQYFRGNPGKFDNKKFTLNATEEMELRFYESGSDTASVKYFALGNNTSNVSIIVNNVATVTQINGKTLTSPLTLGTSTANKLTKGVFINKMIVRSDTNGTIFEVFASA